MTRLIFSTGINVLQVQTGDCNVFEVRRTPADGLRATGESTCTPTVHFWWRICRCECVWKACVYVGPHSPLTCCHPFLLRRFASGSEYKASRSFLQTTPTFVQRLVRLLSLELYRAIAHPWSHPPSKTVLSAATPISDPSRCSPWAGELVREIPFNEADYDGPAVAEFALVMGANLLEGVPGGLRREPWGVVILSARRQSFELSLIQLLALVTLNLHFHVGRITKWLEYPGFHSQKIFASDPPTTLPGKI